MHAPAHRVQVRSHIKFSKASNEGLRVYDSSIHRYSRHHLKSALQFMGIKPHEAVQITGADFRVVKLRLTVPKRRSSACWASTKTKTLRRARPRTLRVITTTIMATSHTAPQRCSQTRMA